MLKQRNCYNQELLELFLDEQLDEQAESKVLQHITGCPRCQRTLESVATGGKPWDDFKRHLSDHARHSNDNDTLCYEQKDREMELRRLQDYLGPTDNPEMLGRLGNYEICGLIGRGSTGVVVKALEPSLNRFVAIKILSPAYSRNGAARRRFEREGRSIAAVSHAQVVPVYAVDEFQGLPYIVMQYFPGGSLHQRIEKQGPLKTCEVVRIGMQVAKGLAEAHKQGIVHRDVKPANVLLENDVDRAMVSDFGLARVANEAAMTCSGVIAGTPQYMSPEQAKGESVDQRSDLFSLGSVMYTACTGRPPFRAETVFGVIQRVCQSQPRAIRETNPEIDKWLTAFIDKLHAKDRVDRFESAEQVADILATELAHMQSPTIMAAPPRSWWNRKKSTASTRQKPVAVFGAAAIVAAAAFAFFGWSGGLKTNNEITPDAVVAKNTDLPKQMEVIDLPRINVRQVDRADLEGDWSNLVFTNPDMPGYEKVGLVVTQDSNENSQLPRFRKTVQKTIEVTNGGQLLLKTNLGKLNVTTHNKPQVELKLIQTVAADDQELADKFFAAMKITYAFEKSDADQRKLTAGRDAAIVVQFPTRKLSAMDIRATASLVELKEKVLIHNSIHFRDARFELRVPEQFNLNLNTTAGSIVTTDIDGWVKLVSNGGHIETGNVSSHAEMKTNGGNIVSGDIGAHATMRTNGGHIEMGSVNGELLAHTNGGHIEVSDVAGCVDASTLNGDIELGHVKGAVKANANRGGIQVHIAECPVNANAPSGPIHVNFIGQPTEDSELKSGTGSIHVGLTKNLAFDLVASSNKGKISGPFVDGKTGSFHDRINSGDQKLTATTEKGTVKFHYLDDSDVEDLLQDNARRKRKIQISWFQRGYDLHMAGELDEAIDAHKKAIQFGDNKAVATYNLGCAWSLKGETNKAFAALNDSITLGFHDLDQFENDDDLNSLRDDGRYKDLISRIEGSSELDDLVSKATSKRNSNNFAEASKLYKEVLDADPENRRAVCGLAYSLHMEGKIDEAIKWHARVAKQEGNRWLGNYNLACVYSLKDEDDLAFEYLNTAVEFGFVSIEQLNEDSDLDNIREDKRFTELIKHLKQLAGELQQGEFDECDEDEVEGEKEHQHYVG